MEQWQLQQRQGLPLEVKVQMSLIRIDQFFDKFEGQVYISFSGGKDSTVLLDLVRTRHPDVEAVFVDTGLEYPEIREFVKTVPNVTWIRPKMNFKQVIEKYGYPVISKKNSKMIYDIQHPTVNNMATRKLYIEGIKRDGSKTNSFKLPKKWMPLALSNIPVSDKCCSVLKKEPFKRYNKETKRSPYIGMMASDSNQRREAHLKTGCNSFSKGNVQSNPMGFWMEKDVWEYIKTRKLGYSKIYDKGVTRTGCMFCMFGVHLEKGQNRFQLMQRSHPKMWDYCINKLGCGKVLDFIRIPYKSEEFEFTAELMKSPLGVTCEKLCRD